MSDKSLFTALSNKSKDALEELYLKYRDEFIGWSIKSYNLTEQQSLDIYQEAVIICYENIIHGKIESLSSSMKTYLFAIGKNKCREYKRKRSSGENFQVFDEEVFKTPSPQNMYDEYYIDIVKKSISHLGNKCKDILTKFYYYNFQIKEIAEELEYKNEASAKNAKYNCMEKLKALFKKELHNSGN